MTETHYLQDILILLAAAIITVPLFQRFRLGSVLGYLIAGIAIGPVLGLVNNLRDCAKGDLTVRVNTSGLKEFHLLGEALSRLIERLVEDVSALHGGSNQLADAVEELSAVTAETSKGVSQQRSQTEQVATAMNEMSATVQEVARNANSAADHAQAANQDAKEGQSVVRETVGAIKALAREVKALSA